MIILIISYRYIRSYFSSYFFIQLHLASEVSVTLTLSNINDVFACSVPSKAGEEYSDMEWIQVEMKRRTCQEHVAFLPSFR